MKPLFLTPLLILIFQITVLGQERYKDIIFSQFNSDIDVVYGNAKNSQGQNEDLKLDLYTAQGDTASRRRLVIYAHGGGFNSGDKNIAHVNTICTDLATRGYVVANINYRTDPNFDIFNSNGNRRAMIDAMHDAKAAVRFLKKNATTYSIDTNFIAMGGESAGAALSMLVNYVDKQAELTSYPMADPNNIEGNSGTPTHTSNVHFALCLCGIMLDTSAMEAKNNAMLWIHSTSDNFIPYNVAKWITTRATNVGLDFEEYAYETVDHCPWSTGLPNADLYLDTTIQRIVDFLFPRVPASVNNVKKQSYFKIQPNPANSSITVESKDPFDKLWIYDIRGVNVFSLRSLANISKKELDVSSLLPGTYFIRIGNSTARFIKN